jgi:Xaa-Pro aminopeptidase
VFRVPAEEIAGRLVAFQSLLKENGIDAAVIRQNADLYYYTGTVQDAHLVVPAAGEPLLMVRRDLTRAEEQSPIRPVVPLRSLSELASAVTSACGNEHPRRVGMELDVLPAALFFVYDENIFPRQQIVDVSTLIRRMRTVKSPWEIEMMRAAGAMSKRIADAVPELLREGIAEFELAAELEALARKAGHAGMLRCRTFNMEMSFGHILSGPNAAVPSYNDGPTGGPGVSPVFGQGGGYRKIRAGELVSVDTVASCHGYFNDQTRNFSIGSPPDRLLDAYAFVREVSERFRDVARPGVVTGKLFEQVWRWAEDAGWGEWFMGYGEPRISFVGHGIGLEMDEYPFIAQGHRLPLEVGMTFAFEPKILIPGLGIAGLENTCVVTEEGIESLNPATEDLVIV